MQFTVYGKDRARDEGMMKSREGQGDGIVNGDHVCWIGASFNTPTHHAALLPTQNTGGMVQLP